MSAGLMQVKQMEAAFQDTQLFVERTLPTLVHLQVCEGLNVVAGHFLPELKAFETRKLEELLTFERASKGVQCSLGTLRVVVRRFAKQVAEAAAEDGVVPFILGWGGDYWPGMDLSHELTLGVSKAMYTSSRGETALARFADLEERAQEVVDARAAQAIRTEREYVLARISLAAAETLASARAQAMQGRPGGAMQGQGKKGPTTQSRSPQRPGAVRRGRAG